MTKYPPLKPVSICTKLFVFTPEGRQSMWHITEDEGPVREAIANRLGITETAAGRLFDFLTANEAAYPPDKFDHFWEVLDIRRMPPRIWLEISRLLELNL